MFAGLDLTGEYLGQTKKKVEEKLNCARGGVLFIDEAYELGKGMYGTEAMTTLVKRFILSKHRRKRRKNDIRMVNFKKINQVPKKSIRTQCKNFLQS